MPMDLKPVTETPEFKAALAASVAKVKEDLLTELTSRFPKTDGDTKGMAAQMDALAMSIASLTDQGTGRRRFPPETVKKWAQARERLNKLLYDARKSETPGSYRVIAKTLLANQLLEPKWVDSTHITQDTIIDWYGHPNLALEPVNEVARLVYSAFKETIDLVGEEVPGLQTAENNDKVFVKGQPIKKAQMTGTLSFGQASANEAEEGLSVKHKNVAGQTVAKHVLGSIAPPIHVPG